MDAGDYGGAITRRTLQGIRNVSKTESFDYSSGISLNTAVCS